MLEKLNDFLRTPGVKISLHLSQDQVSTQEGGPVILRGLLIVSAEHAAARAELVKSMNARNLGPILLRGTAQELETDITSGRILERIQERVFLARAAEADLEKKEAENPAPAKKAAAKKAAAPAKKAAPAPEPAAPQPVAKSGQLTIDDPQVLTIVSCPPPDKAVPQEPPASNDPLPTVLTAEARSFVERVDETDFALQGRDKAIAQRKWDEARTLGSALHQKDPQAFSIPVLKHAMDRFMKLKDLIAALVEADAEVVEDPFQFNT